MLQPVDHLNLLTTVNRQTLERISGQVLNGSLLTNQGMFTCPVQEHFLPRNFSDYLISCNFHDTFILQIYGSHILQHFRTTDKLTTSHYEHFNSLETIV